MTDSPRLLFVGPMLGRNPGWVTTQGEILADLFAADGWTVRETSRLASRPLRLVDTVSCIVRWRRSVDVVVLSVFSGPAFAMADVSSALARALGLPIVMVLHGGALPTFAARHPRWVRRVLARATRIVAPSPYLASGGWLGALESVVIPNVVDLDAIPHRVHAPAAPTMLWMRTFHPAYNPSMAVRAFARVHEQRPDARLTMAGQEKGALERVQAEVRAAGLSDVVRFPGFLDADQKASALEQHDIFLNSNHIDNTPVSVLEAAAAGLIVVATNVGGIPALLEDGRTALLVPDDDDAAMAEAINRVLDDADLARSLSTGARQMTERSSWDAVRGLWTDLLRASARSA